MNQPVSPFNPSKLHLEHVQIEQAAIKSPFVLNPLPISEFASEYQFFLGLDTMQKRIKVDFKTRVSPIFASNEVPSSDSFADFYLSFIFRLENFEALIVFDAATKSISSLDDHLATALFSIAYSTARGILLTRFQGTLFQHFILPVMDTRELLAKIHSNP